MSTVRTLTCARYHSGKKVIRWLPEKASESFKIGQFVKLDLTTGRIEACASDDIVCVGIAAKDASGTVDTKCPVILALPETNFAVSCYHATPSSAITAQTQVGNKYELYVGSNLCHCDIAASTNKFFHVQQISNRHDVGDRYGDMVVKILTDVAQLGPGEHTA